MRSQYLDLRLQADNLARTQKYFLGGMILNHLVAAIDAALTAGKINRSLYKLESNDPTATSWLDGLNVHGGFAWLNGPVSGVHVAWSY
jgi:hypothetical protein